MQWCALDATLQIVDGSINIKYLKNSGIVNVNITSMWLCFQYANVRIFQVWNLCVHKGPFLVVWGFQMQNIESQDTMTCSGCNTGTGTVLGLKYFSTGVPDIILFAMSRVEWWICSSQRSSVLELTRWSGNLQQLGWKLLQVVVIPRKHWTLCLAVGTSIALMAFTFLGSDCQPVCWEHVTHVWDFFTS